MTNSKTEKTCDQWEQLDSEGSTQEPKKDVGIKLRPLWYAWAEMVCALVPASALLSLGYCGG